MKKKSKRELAEIEECRERRIELERMLKAKGWENCLHPDTEAALNAVDAAIFTGCPSETKAGCARLLFYVERWTRELEWHKKAVEE